MNDIDPIADGELAGAAEALVRDTTAAITPAEVQRALDAVRLASADGRDSVGESTVIPMEPERRTGRSRTPMLLAVAAVVVAIVAGGMVLVFSDDDPDSIVTDDPTIPTEPAATVDDVPESTEAVAPEPAPDPTAVPTTTSAPETTVPEAEQPQPIAVSAADPPPLLVPDPTISVGATVPLEVDVAEFGVVEVSIADGVIGVYQEAAGEDPDRSLTIVPFELGADLDADVDRIVPDVRLRQHIIGPGAVAYGMGDLVPFEEGDTMPTPLQLHAYALAGEVGGVQATALLDTTRWVELPPGVLGHGPDGVVARSRQPGETLMGYVANDGAPIEWAGPDVPIVTTQYSLSVAQNRSAVSVEGGRTWVLDIDRDPTNSSFIEPSPAGPTSGGRVLYHERIGEDLTPDLDFGPSAMPALAVLEPDGTGAWYRLPEDWDVAATDVWGTVLMRIDESAGVIELALLDDILPTSSPVADDPSDDGGSAPVGVARGIPYRCVDDVRCTQVRTTSDGRLVAYSPADGTFDVYDPDATAVLSTVAAPTELVSSDAFLWEVGPDDVAYLMASTPGVEDPLSDMWAVPLTGELAGSATRVAEGFGYVGDSTFVPTVDGLARVACCGPDEVRPQPDAPVIGWVDSMGEPTTYDGPVFELELFAGLADADPSLVRRDPDGAVARWQLPHVVRFPRDVPHVVATDDGGALMLVDEPGAFGRWIVRFRPGLEVDGGDMFHLDGEWFPMTFLPDGRVLALDRATERFEFSTVDDLGDAGWPGRLETTFQGDGSRVVSATGLNDFITEHQPSWADSLDTFGTVLAPRGFAGERLEILPDESTGTVLLTTDGLLDDSVAAVRQTVRTERSPDGLLRFVSAEQTQRCQPGRGHQDFRSDPCI